MKFKNIRHPIIKSNVHIHQKSYASASPSKVNYVKSKSPSDTLRALIQLPIIGFSKRYSYVGFLPSILSIEPKKMI